MLHQLISLTRLLQDAHPYLVAMITYARVGAKVWKHVSRSGPALARELKRENIEVLDREILQWYESIPGEIKMRGWDKDKLLTSTPSYNLQRLRIWTYLRKNQASHQSLALEAICD